MTLIVLVDFLARPVVPILHLINIVVPVLLIIVRLVVPILQTIRLVGPILGLLCPFFFFFFLSSFSVTVVNNSQRKCEVLSLYFTSKGTEIMENQESLTQIASQLLMCNVILPQAKKPADGSDGALRDRSRSLGSTQA